MSGDYAGERFGRRGDTVNDPRGTIQRVYHNLIISARV